MTPLGLASVVDGGTTGGGTVDGGRTVGAGAGGDAGAVGGGGGGGGAVGDVGSAAATEVPEPPDRCTIAPMPIAETTIAMTAMARTRRRREDITSIPSARTGAGERGSHCSTRRRLPLATSVPRPPGREQAARRERAP